MMDLDYKVSNALRWSSLAELSAKIISPVVNLILARLLTPEVFGVITTVTMIVSFAEVFSDSGFQKFLIQHEFDDSKQLFQFANVAFSSNLIVAVILWGVIILLSDEIATLAGNPGLGYVISIASLSLPVTSFSSIQSAIYKRNFNYKILCGVRIISAGIPLIVAVPLAWLGFDYWALIVSTMASHIMSAIVLTVKSEWKPQIVFERVILKEMLSFSIWGFVESLGTWLSSYADAFIIAMQLNQYYLGLYKSVITTVNGILAICVSATTTVLFSLLSRLQSDRINYNRIYEKFIRTVSIIIIPMGAGIFIYRDLLVQILLGAQWVKVIPFVGIYGLMSCLTLVYGQYAAEYFRGLGKPQGAVVVTIMHLAVLIPVLFFASEHGFMSAAYARSIVKTEQILAYWIVLFIRFRFNPIKLIIGTQKAIFSSIIMSICSVVMLYFSENIIWKLITIGLSILIYFVTYACILNGKQELKECRDMFLKKEFKGEIKND